MQQQHFQNAKNTNPYLVQKIMSASPDQLIAYVYDAGVTACHNKDRMKAGKAVRVLINSLNFDYKETSLTFFNVYRHVNSLISKGKFDEAKDIFSDLKKTWSKATKVV